MIYTFYLYPFVFRGCNLSRRGRGNGSDVASWRPLGCSALSADARQSSNVDDHCYLERLLRAKCRKAGLAPGFACAIQLPFCGCFFVVLVPRSMALAASFGKEWASDRHPMSTPRRPAKYLAVAGYPGWRRRGLRVGSGTVQPACRLLPWRSSKG